MWSILISWYLSIISPQTLTITIYFSFFAHPSVCRLSFGILLEMYSFYGLYIYLQPLRLTESKDIAFIYVQLNICSFFFFSIHQIVFSILPDFILMTLLKAKYLWGLDTWGFIKSSVIVNFKNEGKDSFRDLVFINMDSILDGLYLLSH